MKNIINKIIPQVTVKVGNNKAFGEKVLSAFATGWITSGLVMSEIDMVSKAIDFANKDDEHKKRPIVAVACSLLVDTVMLPYDAMIKPYKMSKDMAQTIYNIISDVKEKDTDNVIYINEDDIKEDEENESEG